MIIKKPLKWNGTLIPFNKTKVDGITLHHMAHPSWSFEEVHDFHQNTRKWDGIGYNYFISFDGKIYEGRGMNIGAHVRGANDHLIGIGFQGDYEKQTMTDEQFNAGIWLINYLKGEFSNIRVIHGHKNWAATSCPGKNFPLIEMVTLKPRGRKEELRDDVSSWAREAQQWVIDQGISDGKDPKKHVTREEVWTMLKRALAGEKK
jgi:N-acetylmuramoyl-L-alanine amidase